MNESENSEIRSLLLQIRQKAEDQKEKTRRHELLVHTATILHVYTYELKIELEK